MFVCVAVYQYTWLFCPSQILNSTIFNLAVGMDVKGKFPTELGHLSTLRVLEVDVNEISGSIPDTFYRMEALNNLHLSHNKLTGSLPTFLAQFRDLISIDV